MSQFSTNQPEIKPEKSRKDYTLTIFLVLASLVMVVSGAVGFVATSMLLKLPRAESCPKVFSPFASASMRLYCAQLASEAQNVSGWVEAITMVKSLPSNHPLRPEIDRNIALWVQGVINEGENLFQQGKIDEAVTLLEQIPREDSATILVKAQQEKWQSIWREGESKQQQVEKYITTRNWNQAYREAAQLTTVNNRYWSNVQYEVTLNRIQSAQAESSQLDSAYVLLETGELDDLLIAIDEADKITEDSLAYQEAQELISTANNEIVKFIQAKIDQRDWQGLQAALDKITPEDRFSDTFQDWSELAQAGITADQGTVEGISEAITLASQIKARSSVYYEAQKLISRWELEVKDVEILAEARSLAKSGRKEDLTEAISTASNISAFNPRYQEAQTEISNWNRQIQIIEDQPILERAQKLARGITLEAWQEAIAQANLIKPSRPLYSEAQKVIEQSRYNIEITQNQPLLDQATRLANQENWADAIAIARQIPRGRALYPEAQEKLELWQTEIDAQDTLAQAYRFAATNQVNDLIKAIQLANQIPNYTSVASASQEAVKQWSEQLLAIAEDTANYDLEQAISIANNIPRNSSVYNSARTYMEIWRKKQSRSPLDFS